MMSTDVSPVAWLRFLMLLLPFLAFFLLSLISRSVTLFSNTDTDRIAVAIKSFGRQACALNAINAFRIHYPDLHIFVADDSGDEWLGKQLERMPKVTYMSLGYDVGVSKGRNILVQAVHKAGYRYILISDDDYEVSPETDVDGLLEALKSQNADVVAPSRCDEYADGSVECVRSMGAIVNATLPSGQRVVDALPYVDMYGESYENCVRSDIVQQFFVARTHSLVKHGWDNHLMNNDHYDFLFGAQQANLRLFSCMSKRVRHVKAKCFPDTAENAAFEKYHSKRTDRWFDYLPYYMRKWNIDVINTESGKVIAYSPDGRTVNASFYEMERLHGEPSIAKVNLASELIDQRVSAWNKTRVLQAETAGTTRLNNCMNQTWTKFIADYDRPLGKWNRNMSVRTMMVEVDHDNCPHTEKFMRLSDRFRVAVAEPVYLVTAVKDCFPYVARLVSQLEILDNADRTSRNGGGGVIIYIADFSSSDGDIQHLMNNSQLKFKFIKLQGNFSRTIGLHNAIEAVRKDTGNSGVARIFTIDTSVLPQPDFISSIRRFVIPGVSLFAPVMYKIIPPPTVRETLAIQSPSTELFGWWQFTSYGMMGFSLRDYDATGGFDLSYGYKWGAEDMDLASKFSKKLVMVRPQQDHLYHLRRDETRDESYYDIPNKFSGMQPSTPLSRSLKPGKYSRIWAHISKTSGCASGDDVLTVMHCPGTSTATSDVYIAVCTSAVRGAFEEVSLYRNSLRSMLKWAKNKTIPARKR